MVDRSFADGGLAGIYDLFCSWDEREDFGFYLPYAMAASSVLDVGCGTGGFLHGVRDSGHTGRLRGIDPAAAMLEQARTRTDVEWVLCDAAAAGFEPEFDLVVMTGHACQALVRDEELDAALAGISRCLVDGGRFAFESRDPLARAWEQWVPANAVEATDSAGAVVRMEHEVEIPVDGDAVCFVVTFTCSDWPAPQLSRSTLMFLGAESSSRCLAKTGFLIEEQFGDFEGRDLDDARNETITIATKKERT